MTDKLSITHKWHKLPESKPPNNHRDVIAAVTLQRKNTCRSWYRVGARYESGRGWRDDFGREIDGIVYAWCEYPKLPEPPLPQGKTNEMNRRLEVGEDVIISLKIDNELVNCSGIVTNVDISPMDAITTYTVSVTGPNKPFPIQCTIEALTSLEEFERFGRALDRKIKDSAKFIEFLEQEKNTPRSRLDRS